MTNTHPIDGPSHPRRMTARCPEDLLALAPVLLGFWPDEDVVMLTFGGPRPFHARVDLPRRASTEDLCAVRDRLLAPARAHDVGGIVLCLFGRREPIVRAVARTVRRAARADGIEVIACIWADGTHYRLLGGALGGPAAPVAYDVTNHPFVVQAIVDGTLTFASREEMVASLEPCPELCEEVGARLAELGLSGPAGPVGRREQQVAVEWAQRVVTEHVADDRLPEGGELARLVWTLQAVPVRDAVWATITRHNAVRQRRLWAGVLPQTPEAFVAPVADLLAFAAWQSGDGALAWAAVDRAQRAHPDDTMAGLLAGMLEAAVPPDAWPA